MNRITLAIVGAALAVFLSAPLSAQVHSPVHLDIERGLDSGIVVNGGTARDVIFAEVLAVPDVSWLRLRFDQATLGAPPAGGEPTVLRLTSLFDGAVQTMAAEHLQQWQLTSAYLNGNVVLVEIIADPGAGTSHIVMSRLFAGPLEPAPPESICGPTDDRLPSDDPRAARIVPIGCTAWLIDDANRCFLTAGHCTGSGFEVIEFNVPLSSSGGSIQHPGPEDQYAIDPVSLQTNGGQGVGNDWGYFGCFPNTVTGLTPFEAQGDYYVLADTPPPVSGQSIRITGYGTTSSGVPPEWNQVQKTHVGPYATFSGTTVQYQTDTTGGNSGSPVILEDTGEAIGIHTHGGCGSTSGENSGTGINHGALQDALANPQGVCLPLLPIQFTYPGGIPDLLAPAGQTVQVVVTGANGGEPSPGTGMLHYDAGDGLVSVPMVETNVNEYDAVFPALPCETAVSWFVSADTIDGETINDPSGAPDDRYDAVVGDALDFAFEDDFEHDMGWTVEDDALLTTGTWERGTPAGFGDRGDPATDADGSGQCYVTGIADGDNDIDDGATILTSPTMDASGGDPHITYWRWYSNNTGSNPAADIMVVEVSDDDGATWAELEVIGPDGPDVGGGWVQQTYRVADFIAPTSQFRIRFTASDLGGGSIVEAGVDGVRLSRSASGVTCDATCPADVTGDGTVNVDDLLALLGAWGPCADCPADIDEDGDVDVDDLLALLGAWGPCPD